MTDQQLPAPCGLDCAACDAYRAAQDPAIAVRLAEEWRSRNPDAVPEWFRCQGCHGDRTLRWCEECTIADCCEKKALPDCSHCADFPCQPYHDWVGPYAHHQAAYERLKRLAGQSTTE